MSGNVLPRSLTLLLALFATIRAPIQAQTCRGLAPFSAGPAQVSGKAATTRGSNDLSASLGYGFSSGVFGLAVVGTRSVEAFEGSALDLGASAGYQIPLGTQTTFELCPVIGFNLGIGPNKSFSSDVDRSSRTASLGVSVGTSLRASPRLRLVPNAGIYYSTDDTKAVNSAGTTLFEISDSHGLVQLGLGMVLSSNISIRPGVDIPIGLEGSEPTISLMLGYNFGRRSQP
jgi:hypothetical protein